jgi:hypothetical protein
VKGAIFTQGRHGRFYSSLHYDKGDFYAGGIWAARACGTSSGFCLFCQKLQLSGEKSEFSYFS